MHSRVVAPRQCDSAHGVVDDHTGPLAYISAAGATLEASFTAAGREALSLRGSSSRCHRRSVCNFAARESHRLHLWRHLYR